MSQCGAPNSIELNDENAVPNVDVFSYYVTLSCQAGYDARSGTDDSIYCFPTNTQQTEFAWSNDTLVCDAKTCGTPPSVNQISLNCDGNDFGDSCVATCVDSDKHLNMGFGYNCELSGNSGAVAWVGAAGCGVSTCAWTAVANSASADCTVTCAEGYELKGSVKCEKGTFTKMAKCIET